MKKLIIISLLSGVTLLCNAQSNKIKKAEKLIEVEAYAEALEYYDALLEQGVDSSEVAKNVALAYYELRDPEGGEEWYSVVIKNNPEPQDYLNYAEMLKSNGKYTEAHELIEKYSSMNSENQRAEQYLNNENYYVELAEKSRRFDITNEFTNPTTSDFAPMYFGEKLVFCSDLKPEEGAIKHENKTTNKPFINLYQAQLDSAGGLSQIRPLDESLMSTYHEGPLTFNKRFDQLYFTRSNVVNNKKRKASDNQIKLQIFFSERIDTGWSEPIEFEHNNHEYSVGHPALSPDGQTLYFVSDMKGGQGGTDLYMCQLVDDSWSAPENMGSRINSSGNEMFPYIHSDGTLYYSSDGLLGLGGLDIFECRPTSYGFKSPVNLQSPMNTSKDDFGLTLNKDKTAGYISSNRKKDQTTDDIYHFSRIDELSLLLSGVLVDDSESIEKVRGAQIRIIDEDGNVIETKKIGDDGQFDFEVDSKYKNFKIQTNDGTGWIDHSMTDKLDSMTEAEEYNAKFDFGTVILESNPLFYDGIPIAEDNSKTLVGYEVTIKNKTSGTSKVINVEENGALNFILESNTDYEFEFKKPGWTSELKSFNSNEIISNKLTFQEVLSIYPTKSEVGQLLAIKNINYDFNKSNIRPDAQVILNELIITLQKNPDLKIEIASHTDARGSAAYNNRLSQRRAKAVVNYLAKNGISKKRLKWKGYGESKLKNKCKNSKDCEPKLHEENRRTEFVIIAVK